MALQGSKLALFVILIAVGLYFVLFHRAPLPLNHEAIGLGFNHLAHSAFGLVLWAGAAYLWYRARK